MSLPDGSSLYETGCTVQANPGNKKPVDILLVPPVVNPFFSVDTRNFMPLGLLALVASLRETGLNPLLYRPQMRMIKPEDYRDVSGNMLSCHPRIIGFSTWCISYPSSLLVAREIKKADPAIPIIFGGPQASLLGRETLKEFHWIDYVLEGEADFTLPQLVHELLEGKSGSELRDIPGLVYRAEDGQINSCKQPLPVADLDVLPVPAYDLVTGIPSIKLDAGRGCPFSCTYCSTNVFFSKKYRTKSVARICHEILTLAEKYHTRGFSFAHDLFTLNKRFVMDLCNELISAAQDTGKPCTWTCSARIDTISGEMLQSMKKAGCRSLFFGIESGSKKIQSSIRKNLPLGKVNEIADICREEGLDMHASFIAGFPDEDARDLEKTLRAMMELVTRGAIPQISGLALLPGTPLFNQYKQQLAFDGRFSNFSDSLCSPEELSMIMEYPFIFSSFYYLPVKLLDHSDIHLLCMLANYLGDFRNTFFLMKAQIDRDLQHASLISLFNRNKEDMVAHLNAGYPLVTWITAKFSEYLTSGRGPENPPWLGDIFAYEAVKALLLTKFVRWQLIAPGETCAQPLEFEPGMPMLFKSSPAWQLLDISFRPETALPSLNGWRTYIPPVRKYLHSYLMVAVSEKKCRHIKLTKKQRLWLEELENNQVIDINVETGPRQEAERMSRWLKKLIRLGVIISVKVHENSGPENLAAKTLENSR